MKIEVLLFARMREVFGADSVTLDMEDPSTAGHVARKMVAMKPEIASVPLRLAVNDEFVEDDRLLQDGDTVAIVQPVSGG